MFRNETNYVLTNGVLLDGTEKMTPQTGRDIYIEGGRIGAVADAAARREGYEVVDLGGQYVLPGLINLHVHLPASGKPKKKASDPKKLVKLITANALTRRIGVKLCEGYAKTELLSGVTTIRTVGGVADFDTIIRDLAAQGRALNLVPEDEAARRLGAGERVYANSENALAWIVDHVDNPGLVHAIQLFKDKARMREELKPLDPDLFFRTCSVDELFKLDFERLETPFVLKPSVGFCSMGVHAVHDRDDWQRALSDIAQNASAWHDLYPESVVGTGSFMLEGYLEGTEYAWHERYPESVVGGSEYLIEGYLAGTEYALDAYFDETGAAHVLDVLRHDFAGPADTSDRLYVTSASLVRDNAALFESWLDRVNARVGARNFPVHVEVRVRDGHVSPIEFNPLRFAGLGGTDVSWLAYGFRTYAAFLDGEAPAWDDVFRGKEGKVYSMSLLNAPADASGDEDFDYDAFLGRFSHVLEMRRFDVDRVGSYGFLFLETDQDTADELEFVKTCDLTEFLQP